MSAERAVIARGVRDSIPLGIALAAVATAFGYAAHEAGLNWWLAGLMSLTTYGGPSQFLAVALIGIGAAVPTIVATVFVANLRYSLFAASIAPQLQEAPRRRLFGLAFGLADGSYALTLGYAATARQRRIDLYLLGSILVSFGVWVPFTMLGNLIGEAVPAALGYGLRFATPAIFTAFLAGTLTDRTGVVVMVIAGAATVVGHEVLPTGVAPVAAISLAAVTGGLLTCRHQPS